MQIEEQEKTLSRLRWLIQRSHVGYKGNPLPFETPKTQLSVESAKKCAAQKLAGDRDFLPFRRGKPSLGDDARTTRHLRDVVNTKFERNKTLTVPNHSSQSLDRKTGKPEMMLALCWDIKIEATDEDRSIRKNDDHVRISATGKDSTLKKLSGWDLSAVSPVERGVISRKDALNHPKFTKESRELREGVAWYRGSQLTKPLSTTVSKSSVRSTTTTSV